MKQPIASIDDIIATATRIAEDKDAQACVGQIAREPLFTQLVEAFRRHLPKSAPEETVRNSLFHLLGQTLSTRVLRREAWRLAANKWRLRQWRPVGPWTGHVTEEWAPVQVDSVVLTRQRRKPAARLKLAVLAGVAATESLEKVWSTSLCAVISQRLGFSKPWGDYPFRDARQLTGMRFYIRLKPELCRNGLDFEEIWHHENGVIRPVSAYEHNRQLLNLRKRSVSGYACPDQLPFSIECHRCYVGQDRCELAVHALTYIRRLCGSCQEVEWFDPAVRGSRCIMCVTKSLSFD